MRAVFKIKYFRLVCKLKILQAVEKKFVPTLVGLLFETKFGKYIVTQTSKKKFSTRNPAVFFKTDLECGKRMNTRQVTSERRKPEVSYGSDNASNRSARK